MPTTNEGMDSNPEPTQEFFDCLLIIRLAIAEKFLGVRKRISSEEAKFIWSMLHRIDAKINLILAS